MYTVEWLEQMSLPELKVIVHDCGIVPAGDRRCRQNWIDALVGVQLPLLELLETSPGVEPEPVQEAIESPPEALECPGCGAIYSLFTDSDYLKMFNRKVICCLHCNYVRPKNYPGPIQSEAAEPIEVQAQEPIESKFDRIIYPRPTAKPIKQAAKNTPGGADGNTTETDGSETYGLANLCADSHHPRLDTPELHGSIGGIESRAFPNQKGDRVLATARDGQRGQRGTVPNQPNELIENFTECDRPPNRGDGRGRLENESKLSQSAIARATEESDCCYCNEPEYASLRAGHYRCYNCQPKTGITFSPRFLATYLPYFGEVHYKSDADGQLNLLESETENEPPDPDDFDSLDAFQEMMDLWDSEYREPLEVLLMSLNSMCEWAPCSDDWYEPTEVSEPSSAISQAVANESSDTCNFFIPIFGVFKGDRPNGNFLDEPPTAGTGVRRPKPKPPSFSPMAASCPCGAMPAAQCDGTTATHIYPDRIVFTPCYKSDLVGAELVLCDRVGARAPPGGDVYI